MSDAIDILKVVRLTPSTARRVVTADLVGAGQEGDDDNAERFDEVEWAQPAGLTAQPTLTATTEALALWRGDELVAFMVIDKGRPAPAGLEDGETRLYGVGNNNSATVIRLRADGSIEITSANNGAINVNANGSGEVVINGGHKRVAREEDALNVGTLAATAGPYPVIFTYVPGVAGPPTPAVAPAIALGGVIKTGTGADRVKA